MSKFKVGEVVIFAEADDIHKRFIGEECVITELLDKSYSTYPTNQFYRLSLTHEGQDIGCAESCLRKKKPPQETSTWEEVQEITKWNPSKPKVN